MGKTSDLTSAAGVLDKSISIRCMKIKRICKDKMVTSGCQERSGLKAKIFIESNNGNVKDRRSLTLICGYVSSGNAFGLHVIYHVRMYLWSFFDLYLNRVRKLHDGLQLR